MSYRTGLGYDLHRVAPDRPLVLGGVRVEAPFGLLGHSDADVVLHALCDALLGAAALGDIGGMFPDSDPRWRGADSASFVKVVAARVAAAGYHVVNADVMILAERPKLGPLKQVLRARIASLLGVAETAVNVKAGSNEGVDAIGRGEAIACLATVLLRTDAAGD